MDLIPASMMILSGIACAAAISQHIELRHLRRCNRRLAEALDRADERHRAAVERTHTRVLKESNDAYNRGYAAAMGGKPANQSPGSSGKPTT